jgi:hypothetical protein
MRMALRALSRFRSAMDEVPEISMKWLSKTKLFQGFLREVLKQEESGKVEVTTVTGEKFLLYEPVTFGEDFIVFRTSSGAAGRSVTLRISSISHIVHDQPIEIGSGSN